MTTGRINQIAVVAALKELHEDGFQPRRMKPVTRGQHISKSARSRIEIHSDISQSYERTEVRQTNDDLPSPIKDKAYIQRSGEREHLSHGEKSPNGHKTSVPDDGPSLSGTLLSARSLETQFTRQHTVAGRHTAAQKTDTANRAEEDRTEINRGSCTS
jgi:hypothetical protein